MQPTINIKFEKWIWNAAIDAVLNMLKLKFAETTQLMLAVKYIEEMKK